MEILTSTAFIIVGIVLLYFGAELLIKGAKKLGSLCNLSPIAIGLTLVAAGTSMPEFFVSLFAVLNNQSDITVGNIVGSNITNILLVLGSYAFIHPVVVSKSVVYKDWSVLMVSTIIFMFILYDFNISRVEGLLCLFSFIAYVIFLLKTSRSSDKKTNLEPKASTWILQIVFIALGIIGLKYGADLFLKGTVEIAKMMGWSDRFIGLTIVSIGTSLPELFTTIVAAFKKESGIAIGNIIGSNIQNMFLVCGAVAAIKPFAFGNFFTNDIIFMFIVTLILFFILRYKWSLTRLKGAFLLVLFCSYLGYLTIQS